MNSVSMSQFSPAAETFRAEFMKLAALCCCTETEMDAQVSAAHYYKHNKPIEDELRRLFAECLEVAKHQKAA